jgi:hypothetical protein
MINPTERFLVNPDNHRASAQDSSLHQPRVPIVCHFFALSSSLASTRVIFQRSTAITTTIHQPPADLPPMLSGLRVVPDELWHRLLSLAFSRLLRLQRKSLVSHSWRTREKDRRRPPASHRRSISRRRAARGLRELDCPGWCS